MLARSELTRDNITEGVSRSRATGRSFLYCVPQLRSPSVFYRTGTECVNRITSLLSTQLCRRLIRLYIVLFCRGGSSVGRRFATPFFLEADFIRRDVITFRFSAQAAMQVDSHHKTGLLQTNPNSSLILHLNIKALLRRNKVR